MLRQHPVTDIGPTDGARPYTPAIEICLLCTANLCRSPMAAALLDRELRAAGIDAQLTSAGRGPSGYASPPEAVAAMGALGLDLSDHTSATLTEAMLERADLVLGMAREHARDALALDPDAFSRTFTLKELVRRGAEVDPRAPGESLRDWLARVGADRSTRDLLGGSRDDDVADPIGRPRSAYRRTVKELDALTQRLAGLLKD